MAMSLRRALASALVLAATGHGTTVPDMDIYAEPAGTELGCECKSRCRTKTFLNCDSAPVCPVVSKECARGTPSWTLTLGYYDYCVYPKYSRYEDLPAKDKQALLLKRLQADPASGVYPSRLSQVPGLLGESIRVSFDAQSDIFPEPREKYIHSVGTVAPFRWEVVGKPRYSGIFATGAEYGLIRFSSAGPPGSSGFGPGAGVKILRDGRPSANFMAMPSLDPQKCEDKNFFLKDFNSHVPHTDSTAVNVLGKKFFQVSKCIQMVGLSDLADVGSSAFPFKLTLRPAGGIRVECPCDDYAQCLANIGTLKAGEQVFDILATEKPGAEPEFIGKLVLTGLPLTGKFGDQALFFKHQRMEDDFKLHPEWLQQIDLKQDCGSSKANTVPPAATDGCSAAFFPNMGMLADDAHLMV